MCKIETKIKKRAIKLGFSICGITGAQELSDDEKKRLNFWLNNDMAASMGYMKRNVDKRLSAEKLLNTAKSVISVGLPYNKINPEADSECFISSYACYADYHSHIKARLFELADFIQSHSKEKLKFKACVDSVPIAERSYAQRAGLGFIGKNKMLINPEFGSRMFLGELITSLELNDDKPIQDDCGDCHKCLDACPTNALSENGVDCNKCLSYLTIESHDEIPQKYKHLTSVNIYGCDKCVDACPFNLKQEKSKLKPIIGSGFKRLEIEEMDEAGFEQTFNKTPIKRTGLEKLKSHLKTH